MSETMPITLGHYVLGIAGFALLRRWHGGDGDAREHLDRLLELADKAGTDELLQLPLNISEMEMTEGYTEWSAVYDEPNPLIEVEEQRCNPMLERIASDQAAASGERTALDAGCGTGRKAATLVGLGYQVIGCDLTPAMLDKARESVPLAEFRQGVFEELPIDDASVDLVTSSLAVCHATDLWTVFAEFARVLRPGGRILISDPHPTATYLGGQAFYRRDLDMRFVRNQGRPVTEYFTAATDAGLTVNAMHEDPITESALESNPAFALYPEVLRSALGDSPWLFVLEGAKPEPKPAVG